jgi:Tol biopolymer transport system component
MIRSRRLSVVLSALLFGLLFPWPSPVLAKKRGEDRFIRYSRQLTYEGRRSGECYFSPDGKRLVFMSEREPGNPFFQIYVLNLETGDIERVSPGTGKATCPYFQAGTGLLEFASTHADPAFEAKAKDEYKRREEGGPRRGAWDYDETYDIYLFRPDGEAVRQLTSVHGYDAEGGFSPDGKKIVFCSLRDAFPLEELTEEKREIYNKQPDYFGEIYIMDADGGNQTRLTDWPGYDGGPFFTPDGERIVWRHFSEDGLLADIYTMKLDGSDVRRLTDFTAMSWAPFFHPTGEYVIFVSNKLGFDNFELFLVDAAGKRDPVQVTYTERFDGLPTFSPDGKIIVWTSNNTDNGMSQLFMGTWDHEAALAALADSPLREMETKP